MNSICSPVFCLYEQEYYSGFTAFSVEYHFESSAGKDESYISSFLFFLHAPLSSCTVNAITTSPLRLLVAVCCVGASGSTCSKLWNKFPGVFFVFSSSSSPLRAVCGQIDWIHSQLQTGFKATGSWEETTTQASNKQMRYGTENAPFSFLSVQANIFYLPPETSRLWFYVTWCYKKQQQFVLCCKKKKKKKSCWFQVAESDRRRPSRMQPTKTSSVFTWHQSNAKTTNAAEPHRIPPSPRWSAPWLNGAYLT